MGVLPNFPSRYLFTIGRKIVFSLGGWSPQIQAGFPVSGPTREHRNRETMLFPYRAFTFCGRTFLIRSGKQVFCNS